MSNAQNICSFSAYTLRKNKDIGPSQSTKNMLIAFAQGHCLLRIIIYCYENVKVYKSAKGDKHTVFIFLYSYTWFVFDVSVIQY